MNNLPLVSIIIPVYNGSKYLSEAIDSALNQTYKNIEIIVVNDGSNDGGKTREIALSYGDRINYFEKDNGGISSALNIGIKMMKGDYFSWLSHDDIYNEDKVETQIQYLRGNSFADIILFSDYDQINEKSEYRKTVRIKNFNSDKFRLLLLTSFPVNADTILIPKKHLIENGYFEETLKTSQDYAMWHKLSAKYRFMHIAKPLIKYRVHNAQGSKTINTFIEESIKTTINFINTFSDKEFTELTGKKSIPLIYAMIAINFIIRGGEKSGFPVKFMLNKCKKSINKLNLRNVATCIFVMICCELCKFKVTRKILIPIIRKSRFMEF